MALIVSGIVIWAVWFSSIFAVDQVRAVKSDNSSLTPEQVREVQITAGIQTGEPIAWVDADSAAQDVANLAWIKSVEVRRGWPNEIVIAVEMRTPVARVSVDNGSGGVSDIAVDSDGITFNVQNTDEQNLKDLPVIDAQGDGLVAAVTVLTTLPPDLAQKVESMKAESRDAVELKLKSGSLVRWGSAEEPDFKAQVLSALLTRRAEIYDVSAPELPTTTNEKGRRN